MTELYWPAASKQVRHSFVTRIPAISRAAALAIDTTVEAATWIDNYSNQG
jgi:hypothetical protein